ncbi:MAG TPA: primosomal protein N' [Thiobacillaceae bacterium]|nr:primosomal protein N' [Thiobacillaceae bacterium]
MKIAKVALEVPLPQLFDYRWEVAEADADPVGRRVLVPFGRRLMVGVVLALTDASDLPAEQIKPARPLGPGLPPLPKEILALAGFAADYYHHPRGAALLGVLPPVLKRPRPPRLPQPAAYALTPAGRDAVSRLPARATRQRALATRLEAGAVDVHQRDEDRSLARDWLRKGWLEPARPAPAGPPAARPPELTTEQAAAVNAIRGSAGQFAVWLLHGVTGSGKTEVYLRLIEAALAEGRQTLVLIPEIHLTPQMEERFRQRFPGAWLVNLHSGLAEGQRLGNWCDCLEGRADLVLGTRLSVFTPLERLGLVIVDEEHDASYKQMEGLRYSARDVAVWRARQRGIPIVLGSATPSLETWRNAEQGRYRRLDLPTRATGAELPRLRLVDTRTDRPRQGLTKTLLEALAANLERGEQSLVFINRRGYAPTLLCNACGWVAPCPRCSAHLVLHREHAAYRLHCHHCGLTARPVEACPDCGALDLRPAGQGTQKVEETLAELFPQARLLRVDRDTTARKGSFSAIRDAIAEGAVDILVGTQILAKGHDFPRLTLVGVAGADQALHSPDFRATERLFAQLMQVAGRAGRARHPGQVLVQTAFPAHPLYQALVRHDYAAFAAQTLRERREADFPPFAHQALLRADGRDALAVQAFLLDARAAGLAMAEGVRLYDPAPALMQRVAHRERMQLLAQSRSRASLQRFLDGWLERLRALPVRGVSWSLDIDPLDF